MENNQPTSNKIDDFVSSIFNFIVRFSLTIYTTLFRPREIDNLVRSHQNKDYKYIHHFTYALIGAIVYTYSHDILTNISGNDIEKLESAFLNEIVQFNIMANSIAALPALLIFFKCAFLTNLFFGDKSKSLFSAILFGFGTICLYKFIFFILLFFIVPFEVLQRMDLMSLMSNIDQVYGFAYLVASVQISRYLYEKISLNENSVFSLHKWRIKVFSLLLKNKFLSISLLSIFFTFNYFFAFNIYQKFQMSFPNNDNLVSSFQRDRPSGFNYDDLLIQKLIKNERSLTSTKATFLVSFYNSTSKPLFFKKDQIEHSMAIYDPETSVNKSVFLSDYFYQDASKCDGEFQLDILEKADHGLYSIPPKRLKFFTITVSAKDKRNVFTDCIPNKIKNKDFIKNINNYVFLYEFSLMIKVQNEFEPKHYSTDIYIERPKKKND